MEYYFLDNFLVINSIRFCSFDRRRMSIYKLLRLFLYWLLDLSLWLFNLSIILYLFLFLPCIRIIVAVFDRRRRACNRILNLLESIFEEASNFIHGFLCLVRQTFFFLWRIWFVIRFLRLNLLLLFKWILVLLRLFLLLDICCLLIDPTLILNHRGCVRLF